MTSTLTLGKLDLTDSSGSAWGAGVEAEGTTRGAPVPIEVAVKSWLQDGSIVITQGYDNRDVSIRVRMWATDLAALADAELALFAELGKPNTLTWTPADGFGAPAVFVVVTSSMVQDDQTGSADLAESQRLIRTYNLRLVCEAFTRSATPFTSAGTAPGGSTTTVLDACAATTGWAATVDRAAGTVTTAVGPPTSIAVSATLSQDNDHTFTLQKTFAATTSTTNLLVVDWLPTPTNKARLVAVADGVQLPVYAEAASPTIGYTRTWFKVAAASLAVLRLTMQFVTPGDSTRGPVACAFRVDNISVTNVVPISGTNRQQLRGLAVPGSARTAGSLAIESATAALGDTLVYVYPADDSTTGYMPSLRQFRTSGNAVTADATRVSGFSEPLNGSPVQFDVPIGLFPRGEYLLMARVATSGGGTPLLGFNAKTTAGGLGIAQVTGGRTVTTTAAYQNVVIGRIQLPTIDLDVNAAAAGILMSLAITASTTCTYDEIWLFNRTIGQIVAVDCGTGAGAVGGSSRRLFIEPPTVTLPRPTIRVGHNADRSDSHFPDVAVTSWDMPMFTPSMVNVLAVTPNATDAAVSLFGYARWHTNPAA